MLITCLTPNYGVSFHRLVKMGFDNMTADETESTNLNESRSSSGSRRGVQFHIEPHIAVDSGLLIELLNGIYFAM